LAIVVLDTDAASKLFERRLPAPVLERLMGQTLMITFVTIAEAVYGSRSRRWGARRTTALEQYYQRTFAVLPTRSQHLIPVAWTCGALRADAEQRGITVPSNDAWVAACCVTFGYPLLTLNRKHFEPLAVSGLRLL
jgi:predicted nucleic acid-binding protein